MDPVAKRGGGPSVSNYELVPLFGLCLPRNFPFDKLIRCGRDSHTKPNENIFIQKLDAIMDYHFCS